MISENPLQDAMLYAIDRGDIATVRELIKQGADVDGVGCIGEEQRTPLAQAVYSTETPEIVSLLVANGADINRLDPQGKSPLHLSVEAVCSSIMYGPPATANWAVTKALLRLGANEETCDNDGRKPIEIAAGMGQFAEEAIAELLAWKRTKDSS